MAQQTVKRKRFSRIIAAIGAFLFISGTIWLVKEASELWSYVSARRSLAPSSSMEPYELSFKIATESGGVNEWKLAIPRAFVVDKTGHNGDIAPWTGTNTKHFSATFKLLKNITGQFVPESAVTDRNEYGKKNRLIVRLRNGRARNWIVKNDLCVSQDKFVEQAEKFNERSSMRPCYEQVNTCDITTHIDGWVVAIAATRDLYNNPQEVCRIAKQFLNKYTISRKTLAQLN